MCSSQSRENQGAARRYFLHGGPISPLSAELPAAELLQQEGARVAVLNGSTIPGWRHAADYLKAQGINVTETSNADGAKVYSEIEFFSEALTVKYLVEMMQISDLRIRHTLDLAKSVDIVLIVGITGRS